MEPTQPRAALCIHGAVKPGDTRSTALQLSSLRTRLIEPLQATFGLEVLTRIVSGNLSSRGSGGNASSMRQARRVIARYELESRRANATWIPSHVLPEWSRTVGARVLWGREIGNQLSLSNPVWAMLSHLAGPTYLDLSSNAACYAAVDQRARARGRPFDVIARVRHDLHFFRPLPEETLAELAAMGTERPSVWIPEGQDFIPGILDVCSLTNSAGAKVLGRIISDSMGEGGAASSAMLHRLMLRPHRSVYASRAMPEELTSALLHAHRVRTVRFEWPHCRIDRNGHCRYPPEAARVVRGLLDDDAESAESACGRMNSHPEWRADGAVGQWCEPYPPRRLRRLQWPAIDDGLRQFGVEFIAGAKGQAGCASLSDVGCCGAMHQCHLRLLRRYTTFLRWALNHHGRSTDELWCPHWQVLPRLSRAAAGPRLAPPADYRLCSAVPSKCTAVSIGLGGDVDFEDALVARGCKVHAFDPTLSLRKRHEGFAERSSRSKGKLDGRLHFHFAGLGTRRLGDPHRNEYGEIDRTTLRPLQSLLRLVALHPHERLFVLKIDCEGCEWQALAQWGEGISAALRLAQNLIIELHLTPKYGLTRLDLLFRLLENIRQAGLHPWHTQLNIGFERDRNQMTSGLPEFSAAGSVPCCVELHFTRAVHAASRDKKWNATASGHRWAPAAW